MENNACLSETPRPVHGALYALPVLAWLYGWMLVSMVFPTRGVSHVEKRELAAFPSLDPEDVFAGRFFPGVSFWFADHFPARGHFLSVKSHMEPWMGLAWHSIRLYRHAGAQPEPEFSLVEELQFWAQSWQERADENEIQKKENTAGKQEIVPGGPRVLADEGRRVAQQAGAVPPEKVHVERVENVFIYGQNAFYIFGGSERNADRYARIVSDAAAKLSGVAQVYCMLVPTAIEILLPSRFQGMTNPQKPFMTRISSGLKGVVFVDIHTELQNEKSKYLYYRTDHHWTPLGAYIGYQKFAAAAGYTPNPLSFYKEIPVGKYWGSLYAATHNKVIGANPDEVTAYKPPGKYRVTIYNRQGNSRGEGYIVYEGARSMSDKYTAFLGGDNPCMEIVNEGTPRRGKKLLIVKESFGNVFVPFVAPDYREVHVADIRTFPFGLVSYVRAHGIDEILFINNMFAACDPYRVREIERIVNRP